MKAINCITFFFVDYIKSTDTERNDFIALLHVRYR